MEPSAVTKSLASSRLRLVAELENVRLALADQIRADLAAGVRQVDLAKLTGYTREQIRRIALDRSADTDTGAAVSP